MKYFLQVVKCNINMQYKNYFFNKSIYMSLLLWPLIMFINAYYSYKPFSTEALYMRIGLKSYEELYIFLFIGFVSMMFFWSLVQSAWQSSFMYRISGTLELLYMTPASRIACLLGNSIASLVGSVWMLLVFSIIIFIVYLKFIYINILSLIIGIFMLFLLSICWGVFLNSLFLLSRDGGFLYTILEAPMEIFSGVKLPFTLMPLWAKCIGILFPLTYIITILRKSVLFGTKIKELFPYMVICCIIAFVLIVASYFILSYGEKQSRITGSATLF